MTRTWITLALGALVLLPPTARAQDGEVAVFTVEGRPRIGVIVDMNANSANTKLGATIQSVTPDGPAAKAGLLAGDIITKFNGTSLAGGDAPGERLVELAQQLSPGDTAKVDYRRGSSNRSATIVAADLGGTAFAWSASPDGEMFEVQRDYEGQARAFEGQSRAFRGRELAMLDMERSMGGMGKQFTFQVRGGSMPLDLAEMNAGLGEYFGTAKGVLVLENPTDSTLPLKAGDVIVGVDGREPATVGQARRILESYDSGDVAKFEIMRMKKKVTVSWTVPARTFPRMPGGMRWRTPAPVGPPAVPGSAPRMRAPSAPTPPPVRT